MIFREIGNFKGYSFVSIESSDASIPKNIKKKEDVKIQKESLPKSEFDAF